MGYFGGTGYGGLPGFGGLPGYDAGFAGTNTGFPGYGYGANNAGPQQDEFNGKTVETAHETKKPGGFKGFIQGLFVNGPVNMVKGLFSIQGILTLAGTIGLTIATEGAILPFLGAIGLGFGGYQTAKGIADGDTEQIGEGIFATVASGVGFAGPKAVSVKGANGGSKVFALTPNEGGGSGMLQQMKSLFGFKNYIAQDGSKEAISLYGLTLRKLKDNLGFKASEPSASSTSALYSESHAKLQEINKLVGRERSYKKIKNESIELVEKHRKIGKQLNNPSLDFKQRVELEAQHKSLEQAIDLNKQELAERPIRDKGLNKFNVSLSAYDRQIGVLKFKKYFTFNKLEKQRFDLKIAEVERHREAAITKFAERIEAKKDKFSTNFPYGKPNSIPSHSPWAEKGNSGNPAGNVNFNPANGIPNGTPIAGTQVMNPDGGLVAGIPFENVTPSGQMSGTASHSASAPPHETPGRTLGSASTSQSNNAEMIAKQATEKAKTLSDVAIKKADELTKALSDTQANESVQAKAAMQKAQQEVLNAEKAAKEATEHAKALDETARGTQTNPIGTGEPPVNQPGPSASQNGWYAQGLADRNLSPEAFEALEEIKTLGAGRETPFPKIETAITELIGKRTDLNKNLIEGKQTDTMQRNLNIQVEANENKLKGLINDLAENPIHKEELAEFNRKLSEFDQQINSENIYKGISAETIKKAKSGREKLINEFKDTIELIRKRNNTLLEKYRTLPDRPEAEVKPAPVTPPKTPVVKSVAVTPPKTPTGSSAEGTQAALPKRRVTFSDEQPRTPAPGTIPETPAGTSGTGTPSNEAVPGGAKKPETEVPPAPETPPASQASKPAVNKTPLAGEAVLSNYDQILRKIKDQDLIDFLELDMEYSSIYAPLKKALEVIKLKHFEEDSPKVINLIEDLKKIENPTEKTIKDLVGQLKNLPKEGT